MRLPLHCLGFIAALSLAACNSSSALTIGDAGAADLAGTDVAPAGDLAPLGDLAAADLLTASDLASGGCAAAGGTVEMISCCTSQGDFPNLCLIASCSCAPMYTHVIQSCTCAAGKCWNGATCVNH
jgi:hypothetical protein